MLITYEQLINSPRIDCSKRIKFSNLSIIEGVAWYHNTVINWREQWGEWLIKGQQWVLLTEFPQTRLIYETINNKELTSDSLRDLMKSEEIRTKSDGYKFVLNETTNDSLVELTHQEPRPLLIGVSNPVLSNMREFKNEVHPLSHILSYLKLIDDLSIKTRVGFVVGPYHTMIYKCVIEQLTSLKVNFNTTNFKYTDPQRPESDVNSLIYLLRNQ